MTQVEDGSRSGVDGDRLATALSVIAELDDLPVDHPDAVAVRLATARLFKQAKERRRRDRRDAQLAHDAAVTAATATAAPGRIDDETRGLRLSTATEAPLAGTLQKARACYQCKQRYVHVDAFYHQLCPPCAALNRSRRDARTDLTGRRALLTGGRAKIGMHIALRLLRDGADTTITTRFPADAVRRFTSMPDSATGWTGCTSSASTCATRRRSSPWPTRSPPAGRSTCSSTTPRRRCAARPGPTRHSSPRSAAELPSGPLPEVVDLGHAADAHPPALSARRRAGLHRARRHGAGADLRLGLAGPGRGPDRHRRRRSRPGPRRRQQLDAHRRAGRRARDARGAAVQRGRAVRADRPAPLVAGGVARRRTYVVNVSAMEGQFGRGYKGPGHPHTNMAKAALNMLTRTSAQEMLEQDGILMTAVDTGWITDERPHPLKARLHEEGFAAPARPRRRRGPRLRPDRARRARRGPARRLPQGLRAAAW